MSGPDNPPAFPLHFATMADCEGMSLRDYFAVRLGAALISNPTNSGTAADLAKHAYAISDAMLAERAKGGAS